MKRTILVVEDSPTQAELIRLLLEGAGYQVHLASNGREGLEKVRSTPPDLIISDVMMPEMDGYAFCQAVKSAERTRRIPFVLLTQRNTPQDILWGLTRGADNFIPKPFNDEYLIERVKRIFEHLELRQKGQLEVEVTLRVGDRELVISPDKQQIVELLFATFEDVCRLNNELQDAKGKLEDHATNLEAKVQERTEALRRLNRDLRAISLCNQALVRAANEEELPREICTTIVEVGEYRAAWVGFVEERGGGSVRPAAVAGCEPERVDRHAMDLTDPAWETCPVGMAIRTGMMQVVQNIPGNPPRCPWHEEAVSLGIGSAISLPLKKDGRPFGALMVYSALLDAFDAEEVTLLVELANDLAYGIQAIRTRVAHERALAEIESMARFPNENPHPVMRVREGGLVLYANAPSEPLLRLWDTGVGARMPADWSTRIREALETRAQESLDVSCDDRIYSVTMAPIPEGGYVNLYGRDITERKQAEEALRRSAEHLKILREIDRAILAAQSPQAIAEAALKHIRRMIPCQRASVVLFDEEAQERVVLAADTDGPTEVDTRSRAPLERGDLAPCLRRGEVYLVPDLQVLSAPTLVEAALRAEGIRTRLSLPLLAQGILLGALNFGATTVAAFATEQVEIAREVADQLAVGIQQARLHTTAVRRGDELAALLRASRTVMSGLDLQRILDRILTEAAVMSGCPNVQIFLVDRKAGTLRVEAVQGLGTRHVGSVIPLGTGLSGLVGQTGQPVFSEDLRQDPRNLVAQQDRELGLVTYLGLPITIRDEVLGVLAFSTTAPRHYPPDEVTYLTSFADQAAIAIENARLYEATVRQFKELKGLYDLGQAITSSLSLDEQLGLLVERLSQAAGAQRVLVGLGDAEDTGRLRLSLAYDASKPDPWLRQLDLSAERYPEIQEVMRTGRPLVIPEVVTEPLLAPVREGLKPLDLRSMIVVPLIVREKTIGAISLGYVGQARTFTDDEIRLLQSFAAQAAIAIEKARLYEAAQKSAQQATVLNMLTRSLVTSLSPQGVAQKILEAVQTMIPGAAVALREREGDMLPLRARAGFEKPAERPVASLGVGLAGIAAATGKPTIAQDLSRDPRVVSKEQLVGEGLVACLAVPLIFAQEVCGTISIYTYAPHRFSEEEINLLQAFTDAASIALQNARLHDTVRQHAAELEQRVTERTQELAAANQQLAAASRHKSEFLANMSHELRTPLNSILGFSQLLLEQTQEVLPAKQTRFLTNIHNSGQHLLQLINDILDLSKVEAGKFVLQPEPLPVAQTLEDILVIGRGLANKKGQLIETEIAPGLPRLQADPVRFKQILFNLLSNAVKFTPNGGRVTLTARRIADCRLQIADLPPTQSEISNLKSEMLEIAVADTGVGIRSEDLAKLFQEFVQLETTRAQKHEGTGLGLSLTKKLVELHGGRIWAESEGEGKGSTFTVVLPFEGPEGSVQ